MYCMSLQRCFSTISSIQNSVAATALKDHVDPFCRVVLRKPLSQKGSVSVAMVAGNIKYGIIIQVPLK